MKAKYFKSAKDVLFYHPIDRLLAKIFGADRIVLKCKTCGKIPTELYGESCIDHISK